MTLEEMQVVIQAQTKPLRDELNKMQNQVKVATGVVDRETKKINNSFKNMAKIVGSALSIAALAKFGKASIELASNLAEVQNVVDVTFGAMSSQINMWSKTTMERFGMSELSAKKYASTMGAMVKSMGFTETQAAALGTKMAELSGDMASFYNLSQDEAFNKIRAGISGETEPLKQLGINLSVANLEAYAMAQGLNKSYQAMTQMEQTTLRYNYLLSVTKDAQGDFARTSDSWANQLRLLQERWKQFMTVMGGAFIQILTPILRGLNILMSALITAANYFSAFINLIFGKKDQTKNNSVANSFNAVDGAAVGAGNAVDGYNDSLDSTGKQAKKTAKELGKLAGFDELNILSSNNNSDTGSSGGGVGGIGGAGGMDVPAFESPWAMEPDISGIEKATEKIKGFVGGLTSFLDENKAMILSVMSGIGAGLLAFMVIKNWGTLVGTITTVTSTLSNLMKVLMVGPSGWQALITGATGLSVPLLAVIAVIAAVVAAVVYLWNTNDEFKNSVIKGWEALQGVLMNFYNSVLKPLFDLFVMWFDTVIKPLAEFLATVFVKAVDTIIQILMTLWTEVLAPIANFLIDVFGMAIQGVIEIFKAWKPVIDMIFEGLQWLWKNIFEPIVDWVKNTFITVFENWGETINKLIPDVKKMFQGLIDFIVGIFTLDLNKAFGGIISIFQGLGSFVGNIFATDWSKNFGVMGHVLNAWLDTIKGIFEALKRVFTGVLQFIVGVFTGNWGKAWEGVKNIFGGIFDGIAALVKQPLNAVIRVINGAIDGINSVGFDVPDWVPFIGGKKFRVSVPKMQLLAHGGIVNGATPAIVGEAGAEAVIPLKRNTQGLDMIATLLSERMGDTSSNQPLTIYLTLDGNVVSKYVIKSIKDMEKRTGKPVFSV